MPDWDYPARMFNIAYLKQHVTRMGFSIVQDYGTGILLNTIPRCDRGRIDKREADSLIGIEVRLSRQQECRAGGTTYHVLLERS